MKYFYRRSRGFTIVELLIVIVIISILASISLVAYNGIQDRARASKVGADLASLSRAINLARIAANTTLLNVTNNNCTRCACPYAAGDTTNYSTLPKSDSCWTTYYASLDKISAASGANLNALKNGDPWGAPYAIDENEGESGGCEYDSIWSFGKSSNANGGTSVGNVQIPHYGPVCT